MFYTSMRGVVSTGVISLTISISYKRLYSYESNAGVYNISIYKVIICEPIGVVGHGQGNVY